MVEVLRQDRAGRKESESELIPVDLDELRAKFEDEYSLSRFERTIVMQEDGSRTIYETYQMPIVRDMERVEKTIRTFGHIASVLGYRSPIGPYVTPDMREFLGPEWQTYPVVIFHLERTEAVLAQEIVPKE